MARKWKTEIADPFTINPGDRLLMDGMGCVTVRIVASAAPYKGHAQVTYHWMEPQPPVTMALANWPERVVEEIK